MTFEACPSCCYNTEKGMFTGSWFYVYECVRCDRNYCHRCPGSDQGRRCPRCGETASRRAGTVYLR